MRLQFKLKMKPKTTEKKQLQKNQMVQKTLRRTLLLILVGGTMRGLAYPATTDLLTAANKQYAFTIDPEDWGRATNNSQVLGTAWTIDHKLVNFNSRRPKPTFISVLKSGVFMKKFKKPWLKANINVGERTMRPFFKPENSEITAFHMEGGGDLLSLAFKNRTVLIIDVQKSQLGVPAIVRVYDLAASMANEQGDIKAIGHIAYTDFIIFAPSAKILMKRERLGTSYIQVKSPLDKIKFIVAPVKTTMPERDPYNPNYKEIPGFDSELNILVSHHSIVVATSEDTEYAAMMFASNMKLVNYFSVRKNQEKYDNPSEDVVTSICFYGGVPVAHTFALMTKHTNKQVVLLDGIFMSHKRIVNLNTDYQNTKLTWLNGTTYIMACQYDNGDSRCHPTLIDFSSMRPNNYTLTYWNEKSTLPVNSGFQMVPYRIVDPELTRINMHSNLDFLFLTMYMEDDQLIVKPPFFPWNFCRDQNLDGLEGTNKMLIGLYRFCRNPFSHHRSNHKNVMCGGTPECTQTNVDRHAWNDDLKELNRVGFLGNTFRRQCHLGDHNSVFFNSEFFRCSGGQASSLPWEKLLKLPVISKLTWAKLSKVQTPDPLDPHNLRRCKNGKLNRKIILDPSGKVFNQCLLSDFTDLIDDKTLNNPKLYHKFHGLFGRSQSYEHKFQNLFNQGYSKKYFIDPQNRYFLIKDMNYDYWFRPCYYIVPNPEDRRNYIIKVKDGYYLDEIKNDKSGKSKGQIKEYTYTGEGGFNKFYCAKKCPKGYYYDFDSIDCRVCPQGCSLCDHNGECVEEVKEGWHKVVPPKYWIHFKAYNKLMANNTRYLKSCQKGFFLSKETRECMECEGNCLDCEPNPKFDVEDREFARRSRCLQCESSSSDLKKNLYIHSVEGNCSSKCQGEQRSVQYVANKAGVVVSYCVECFVKNCSRCHIKDPNRCIECREGSKLIRSDRCKEVSPIMDVEKTGFLTNKILIIIAVLIGLVAILCCLFARNETTAIQNTIQENNRKF